MIYKIGRGNSKRIGEVHAQNPTRFPVVFFWPDKGHEESRVHAKLESYRLKLGGGREWFRTDMTPFDMYMHCAKLIGDDCASIEKYNLFQQSLHMFGYQCVMDCPSTELMCSDNTDNSIVVTHMSQYGVKSPPKRKRQNCDQGDKRRENDRQMSSAVSTTGDKLIEIDKVIKLALASYDNPDSTEQMTKTRQGIINTYILTDSFVERHIAKAATDLQKARNNLLTCVEGITDLAQPMGSMEHLEQEDYDKVVAKRGLLKAEYSSFWLTKYNCEKAFRQFNALSTLCSNCIDESNVPAPTGDLVRLATLHEQRGGYLDMERVLQMAQQQMNVGVGLVPATIECLRHLGFSDIINDIVPLEGCRWDLVATTLINVIKRQTTTLTKEITSNQRTIAFLEAFLTRIRAGRFDGNTYDKDIHNCLSRRLLEPAFSGHIAKCRPDRKYDSKHIEKNTHIALSNSMWYYELGGFNCHPKMPKVNVIAKRPSDANAQERAMLAEIRNR